MDDPTYLFVVAYAFCAFGILVGKIMDADKHPHWWRHDIDDRLDRANNRATLDAVDEMLRKRTSIVTFTSPDYDAHDYAAGKSTLRYWLVLVKARLASLIPRRVIDKHTMLALLDSPTRFKDYINEKNTCVPRDQHKKKIEDDKI